jgi:hypothetical protein
MNEFVASTKLKLGCNTNPKTGSSSAPAVNLNICARVTPFLLPPLN